MMARHLLQKSLRLIFLLVALGSLCPFPAKAWARQNPAPEFWLPTKVAFSGQNSPWREGWLKVAGAQEEKRRSDDCEDKAFSWKRRLFCLTIFSPACISQVLGASCPGRLATGLDFLFEQETEAERPGEQLLRWGGSFLVDYRSFTRSPQNYSFKEYRVELQAEAGTQKTKLHSTLWVRSLGFSAVTNSQTLFAREKISPVEGELREAYVDFYGFPFSWMDLRVGRQRIAWGTADRVNPTDNLNPDDLEDIWDFGRHLSSDAIRVTGYWGNFTLTGVLIPTFTPASPPLPEWSSALMPPLALNGLAIKNITDEIILPANNFRQSSLFGLKMASNFMGYDFSLSYVHGRDDLPLVRDVVVEKWSGQDADILVRLIYPRMKILGLDMAGAVGGAGVWAEAAVFLPERVKGEVVFPVAGFGLVHQTTIALSNQTYAKWVIGADYTFGCGLYLNLQLARGFLHERGTAELGNYFLFNVEWRLLRDKLKLIPLAGCVEIRRWSRLSSQFAFIWAPVFEYHPGSNTEFRAGLRLIDSRGETNFGRLRAGDEIFFRMKYSF